ncbi:hypothetical protein Clacol_009850 [Clathrus columnatus]|uniref:Ribonucleotide reductase large subunit C-terminal domain-containing protein n=1 Tax=Clathrus columnatus TaxID=1419009 RepID=A0AAV5ALM6_9AGAM|nr:hypothetical protein Clacol_009850 [Clathrus columnatus]
MRHRSIGIGVQGLADTFVALRMPFDAEQAKELNIQIFETIYHAAVEASCDMTETDGPYKTFQGSPANQGRLQSDLWGVSPASLWEWTNLKARVQRVGLRNSLSCAPMPTASTSQILGNNECFEPYAKQAFCLPFFNNYHLTVFLSNIYTRRVLAGEFQVVCPWLLKELVELNLWNDDTRNQIIVNNGSIQSIAEIPDDAKAIYKPVWEISQKKVLNMVADRGAYLRTRPAAQAIQFTVDQSYLKKKTVPPQSQPSQPEEPKPQSTTIPTSSPSPKPQSESSVETVTTELKQLSIAEPQQEIVSVTSTTSATMTSTVPAGLDQ